MAGAVATRKYFAAAHHALPDLADPPLHSERGRVGRAGRVDLSALPRQFDAAPDAFHRRRIAGRARTLFLHAQPGQQRPAPALV